jgi:hypothetical protein
LVAVTFTAEHLNLFIREGTAWATASHDAFHPVGKSVPAQVRDFLGRFFPAGTLDRIRVVLVPALENPDFYSRLTAQGLPMPLDFRGMAAITFVDTVLVSQSKAELSEAGLLSLLFHEAVHVVQYEVLGLEGFMEEYVNGWATSGFEYAQIPLERQAYALQERFVAAPSEPFSVRDEVLRPFPRAAV